MDFNPHHCISGDRIETVNDLDGEDFNPHHCISGDRIETVHDLDGEDFNPHHCISGDTDVDSEADKLEISIHTTASVVTSTFFPYEVVQAISIHTTASVVTEESI